MTSDQHQARAEALLARMTLAERIAQLRSCSFRDFKPGADGTVEAERLQAVMGSEGIGAVQKPSATFHPRENVRFANALQRHAMERTRLGIPLLMHEEGIHGHVAYGATVFPAAIALGCTWNPELHARIFTAIAAEVRARGGNQVLAPVLDLIRDPRWGSCEECYGEDPHHVARLGVAAVRAMQHDGAVDDPAAVAVACKHFAGYGASQGGRNFAPTMVPTQELYETDLAPFAAVVREAGALGMMPAHGEIDGVPLHAHRHLLGEVLRRRWGFEGIIISDYSDIARLHGLHRVAADPHHAALLALAAGVDLDLPIGASYQLLGEALRRHPEAQADLDDAVRRVLILKSKLGLFERPYVEEERALRTVRCAAHRQLALEAAEQSCVLLENRGPVLPLSPARTPRLAVIGPNAHPGHIGTYSPGQAERISILDGLRAAWGADRVVHAPGCRITGNDLDPFDLELDTPPPQRPQLVSESDNEPLIAEAERVAATADAIVLCLGGNVFTAREAFYVSSHLGDRDSITLPGAQLALFRRLRRLGRPLIVVLVGGQPMAEPELSRDCDALLLAWYGGEAGGTAVARLLTGEAEPSGRLSLAIPRHVGQIPIGYRQKPGGHFKEYLFSANGPLYPFGFGLTYTSFAFSGLSVVRRGTMAEVEFSVANTGNRPGVAVPQVYQREDHAPITRPVGRLVRFSREALAPGGSRRVHYAIPLSELAIPLADGGTLAPGGGSTWWVGEDARAIGCACSVHLDLATSEADSRKPGHI